LVTAFQKLHFPVSSSCAASFTWSAAISELAVSAFSMPFLPFVNVFLLLVELE
jgi:hypothetical protein